MRSIDRLEAKEKLLSEQGEGYRGDVRVISALNRDQTCCFLLRLEDETSFLSLIWHDVPESRVLSANQSLLLGDVARRLIDRGWTFEKLVKREIGGDYSPDYFAGCAHLDREFKFSEFGWPTLVLPNETERRRCPTGSFYLMDGTHRTLVLARKILLKEIEYEPVEGLLLLPRPN
jgi:hypothetical protein